MITFESRTLPLAVLKFHDRTQARVATCAETIADYAERLREGKSLPEIEVFFDGAEYWLADGYHRYHAAKDAGRTEYACKVYYGTLDDAILHAAKANAAHGLRRTNADKRKAVENLLVNEEWRANGPRWIAREAAVGVTLAHRMLQEYTMTRNHVNDAIVLKEQQEPELDACASTPEGWLCDPSTLPEPAPPTKTALREAREYRQALPEPACPCCDGSGSTTATRRQEWAEFQAWKARQVPAAWTAPAVSRECRPMFKEGKKAGARA